MNKRLFTNDQRAILRALCGPYQITGEASLHQLLAVTHLDAIRALGAIDGLLARDILAYRVSPLGDMPMYHLA